MTPDQEIERYKRIYAKNWQQLSAIPEVQIALREKNVVRLGELLQAKVYGNFESELHRAIQDI